MNRDRQPRPSAELRPKKATVVTPETATIAPPEQSSLLDLLHPSLRQFALTKPEEVSRMFSEWSTQDLMTLATETTLAANVQNIINLLKKRVCEKILGLYSLSAHERLRSSVQGNTYYTTVLSSDRRLSTAATVTLVKNFNTFLSRLRIDAAHERLPTHSQEKLSTRILRIVYNDGPKLLFTLKAWDMEIEEQTIVSGDTGSVVSTTTNVSIMVESDISVNAYMAYLYMANKRRGVLMTHPDGRANGIIAGALGCDIYDPSGRRPELLSFDTVVACLVDIAELTLFPSRPSPVTGDNIRTYVKASDIISTRPVDVQCQPPRMPPSSGSKKRPNTAPTPPPSCSSPPGQPVVVSKRQRTATTTTAAPTDTLETHQNQQLQQPHRSPQIQHQRNSLASFISSDVARSAREMADRMETRATHVWYDARSTASPPPPVPPLITMPTM